MDRETFIEKVKNLGISWTESLSESLSMYQQLLVEKNKVMNLTAITEPKEVYEKHFYDSFLIYPFVKEAETLCDVGSGAGFPGLVLAIVLPQCHITLLEPTKKRCNFLNEVVERLQLKNVDVVNKRAEDFMEKREFFDVVCARAVANLNMLSELCIPLVKVNGIFIAMKGSKGLEEVELAKMAISTLGAQVETHELSLLSDESLRYNIIIKKNKKTPAQFPRAYGIMKKKPLV